MGFKYYRACIEYIIPTFVGVSFNLLSYHYYFFGTKWIKYTIPTMHINDILELSASKKHIRIMYRICTTV